MNTETERNEFVILLLEGLIKDIKENRIVDIDFEMQVEPIKDYFGLGRSGFLNLRYTILKGI